MYDSPQSANLRMMVPYGCFVSESVALPFFTVQLSLSINLKVGSSKMLLKSISSITYERALSPLPFLARVDNSHPSSPIPSRTASNQTRPTVFIQNRDVRKNIRTLCCYTQSYTTGGSSTSPSKVKKGVDGQHPNTPSKSRMLQEWHRNLTAERSEYEWGEL